MMSLTLYFALKKLMILYVFYISTESTTFFRTEVHEGRYISDAWRNQNKVIEA